MKKMICLACISAMLLTACGSKENKAESDTAPAKAANVNTYLEEDKTFQIPKDCLQFNIDYYKQYYAESGAEEIPTDEEITEMVKSQLEIMGKFIAVGEAMNLDISEIHANNQELYKVNAEETKKSGVEMPESQIEFMNLANSYRELHSKNYRKENNIPEDNTPVSTDELSVYIDAKAKELGITITFEE